MSNFRCVICTPTEKLFDSDVHYAQVPSDDGYFGVMAGHELLVGLHNKGGLCTVTKEEGSSDSEEFLIYKGATQMFNGILTILASFGIRPSDIDKDDVEKHANGLREEIEKYKDSDNPQEKTTRAILKRNLEWDEFQLAYLAGN